MGGLWGQTEIKHLPRPSKSEVREAISQTRNIDYTLVFFCGHGYYSDVHDSTILELRKNQEIDSIELRSSSPRQTIILDCCRQIVRGILLEDSVFEAIAKSDRYNPYDCKKYYNQGIIDCPVGKVVVHSCAIGETAGDDENRGGYYSYNLLRECRKWADGLDIDTSTKYKTRSIVLSHEEAKSKVHKLSDKKQNPQIEKPRTGKYFPFAIVA